MKKLSASHYQEEVAELFCKRKTELGISQYRIQKDTELSVGTVQSAFRGTIGNLKTLLLLAEELSLEVVIRPKEEE